MVGPSRKKNTPAEPRTPITTSPSPASTASQPTTKRPGAARPSIVKVVSPGRAGGPGEPAEGSGSSKDAPGDDRSGSGSNGPDVTLPAGRRARPGAGRTALSGCAPGAGRSRARPGPRRSARSVAAE